MSKNEYDLQLWLRIAEGGGGKIAAFQELFDRYYAPLCRFAEFWIRDSTSAEEVVLDVYTHIWQHAAKLRVTGSVRAYLFRAVRNRSLNHIRDNRFSTSFRRTRRHFAQARGVADRDRGDARTGRRSRFPTSRPLPGSVPQKPQRRALQRRNSPPDGNLRQYRRSADEEGAAIFTQTARQGVRIPRSDERDSVRGNRGTASDPPHWTAPGTLTTKQTVSSLS